MALVASDGTTLYVPKAQIAPQSGFYSKRVSHFDRLMASEEEEEEAGEDQVG